MNGAMLESGLVDRVILFFAPKIVGGGAAAPGTFDFPGVELMQSAITLEGLEVEVLGDNVCISGTPIH
ncbi:Riboflavin biosynthesis protein RibD [compost metagenome]